MGARDVLDKDQYIIHNKKANYHDKDVNDAECTNRPLMPNKDIFNNNSSVMIRDVEGSFKRDPSLRGKKHTEEFKLQALNYWKKHGVTETCRVFGINNSCLYQWEKVGVKSKSKSYRANDDFVESALRLSEELGVGEAAKKMNMSRVTLTRRRKERGLSKTRLRYTDEFKIKVVNYALK